MIQKVYKGSDLMIELSLKDAEGTPYRINTTNGFSIKFFTTNPSNSIEGHYMAGEYSDIIEGDITDYMALNADDLEELDDGILNYVYTIRTANSDFKDGFYDETVKGQTDLYIKSKLNCNEYL